MGKREKEIQLAEQLHATQLESRDREIEKLRQENLRLAQRVETLERQESSVLQAIIQARETAAETVGAAKKQAQEIYAGAVDVTTSARGISENARSIIAQAEEKAAEIMKEAHDSSTRIIAKANERAAFTQSEAKIMFEEYQSLMDNARERLHAMMISNIENIRDFASKLAVLYSDGFPADLQPLLAESVRDIEVHLRQMGAPPAEDSQQSIGYTDAQELVKAIHRMQGRNVPDVPSAAGSGGQAPAPKEEKADEERVWTVDEVIGAKTPVPGSQPQAPERSLEYETDEGLSDSRDYARPEWQPPQQATAPQPAWQMPPQAPAEAIVPENSSGGASAFVSGLRVDSETGTADRFDGLNLRNTGHSNLKAEDVEYVKAASVLRPSNEDAFDGLVLMGQSSKLKAAPKEEAFSGLNLRQGGHSIISADSQTYESVAADVGIVKASPLKRTKEREKLPDGFSVS